MIWFGLVCLVSSISGSSLQVSEVNQDKISCSTDRDCPLTSYCFEDSVCVKCMNCTLKNRLNSVPRCARFYEDCGPCLPGFVDNSYRAKLRCVPVKIVAEPRRIRNDLDDVTYSSSVHEGWYELAAGCIVTLLVLVSYYYYRYQRHKSATIAVADAQIRESSNPCRVLASPPPPYSHEERIQMNDGDGVAYSFQLRISEHSERKNTAVPFQLPKYYEREGTVAFNPPTFENDGYQPVDGAINVTSEEAIDGHSSLIATASNIDIHDENTTPSVWTPGSSGRNRLNDDVNPATENETPEKISPPNKRRKKGNEEVE